MSRPSAMLTNSTSPVMPDAARTIYVHMRDRAVTQSARQRRCRARARVLWRRAGAAQAEGLAVRNGRRRTSPGVHQIRHRIAPSTRPEQTRNIAPNKAEMQREVSESHTKSPHTESAWGSGVGGRKDKRAQGKKTRACPLDPLALGAEPEPLLRSGASICRGYLRGLWPRRCRGTWRWRRTRGP